MTTPTRSLLDTFAWHTTSLGPQETWPSEMRTAIGAVMATAQPACTSWGTEGIQIYNDAHAALLGERHPAAFGAPLNATQGGGPADTPPPRQAPSDGESPRTRRVAHDLNNLLTVILGNLDMLDEQLGGTSDHKLVLNAIQASEEACTLTGTLLNRTPAGNKPKDNEDRYRTLFDLLPLAIWEVDISAVLSMLEGLRQRKITELGDWLDENPGFVDRAVAEIRVVVANRAARALHGIEGDDAGALAHLSLPAHFHMSVRKLLGAIWFAAREFTVSVALTRPDGSMTDVMVTMQLPEQGSGRLVVIERDMTEQLRAEERFRRVAQASSDYIFDRDFATEMTWVNDGASWHPDLPAGPCVVPRGAWVDSVHPEDNERIVKGIEAAIRDGDTFWEGEYRLRKRSGNFIPVHERASILRDAAGAPLRMIGNIVDLTEHKALEAQLRQAQRLEAIGQLTGGIAHDFNNLLTVILGNAEMLADALPTDDHATGQPDEPRPERSTSTMARQIVIASERAVELTQRLLAFARKQPLAPAIHEGATLIEGVRMLIERSITPSITLEMDLPDNVGRVLVDRAMFENALLNLCLNARDAMPEGGSLRIEAGLVAPDNAAGAVAGQDSPLVRIAVSDTGTGMTNDTLVRVFEPFFTTKPPGEGNGLGLSMVYGFVRQSGGDVHIDSTPGKGTTVALLLPAQSAQALPLDRPEAAPAASRSAFRGRILVVEDHAQVRQYTCMLARSLGFDVVEEGRAGRALERLRAGEVFDLLLSDIVMPGGMSGLQLAETVQDTWPGMPVLLVSGHSDDIAASGPTRRESDPDSHPDSAAGIAFMRKPFRRQDLADRLAAILPPSAMR